MSVTSDTVDLGQDVVDVKGAEPDDVQMWSVTTIIGCLDKPALMYWAAEEAAKAALTNERTWKAIADEQGRDEAVKWLRDARFRRPKGLLSATALGSVIHAACEEYALTGVRPDSNRLADLVKIEAPKMEAGDVRSCAAEVVPFLDRFDEWLERFQPSYQTTEVVVYHPTYGYAGTADAFLTIDGVRSIVDYKSSRKDVNAQGKQTTPYPEVALQLAAYRHCEFAAVWRPRRFEKFRRRYYLLSEAERAMAVPVPEVDGGLCIHITPERCEAYPVRCDETVHQAFLFIQEAARWSFQQSNDVIGRALEVPS